VDDRDKSASFNVSATPRRSTSLLDALEWIRGILISSLRSASQPLLIDVAQIHRAADLEMTAAHGRIGIDAGRPENLAHLRTLRFAGAVSLATSICSVGRDALIDVAFGSMLLSDAWRFTFFKKSHGADRKVSFGRRQHSSL
jgi:hypothetical protein